MKIVQVIFAALPLITAPVSAAAANPVTSGPIALNVSLRFGSLAQNYTTMARVVSFAPNYSARIVYAGGRRGFDGTYNGIPDVVASTGSGLVMNGGFYTSDPSSPAGLLLVQSHVISPFNFNQSAMLCVTHSGKLTILRTSDIRGSAGSITRQCTDGLQSYPVVVAHGGNDVRPTELKLSTYTRSLIGLRADGSIVAVFFQKPVHLYAAAEFMRAPQSSARKVEVTGVAGQQIHASSGLGIVDAVNLSGDVDSFAAVNGTVIVGNMYRAIPSAIVVK